MAASALLNIMVKAAHKAGRSLTRDFGEVENLQVSRKGPADFVSNADLKAEEIIRDELLKARPTYSFLMEEGGAIKGTDGQHRWIIDPLDGTTNFLHSIPLFASAIALERNGEIVASVIYNPIMEETFTAERGGGAWLNERRRLRVAGRRSLADAVAATGIKLTGTDNDTLQLSDNWRRSTRWLPASGAPVPPAPTWPGWPRAVSTSTGKQNSRRGTSPPGTCWFAKPVDLSPIIRAITAPSTTERWWRATRYCTRLC